MGIGLSRYFIDAHLHIMTEKRNRGGLRWAHRMVKDFQSPGETDPEILLDHAISSGADYVFNLFYPLQPGETREIHLWQHQFAACHPQVIPFASIHPGDEDKISILTEALDELGLAGVKIHPYVQNFDLLDRRMDEVYAYIEERRCPLLIHTGFADFYGLASMAEQVDTFLRKHPHIKTVLVHMLWPDLEPESLLEYLEEYQDMYLDITNTACLVSSDPAQREQLSCFMARYSHRILAGSDFPMSVAYPLSAVYQTIYEMCPDRETAENVCWRTAVRLVGPDRFPGLLLDAE